MSSVILDAYLARTPTSARWAERARGVLPGGIAHDSRYLKPYPLTIVRAAGSHKWDADGHEYVDYSGGHGALLLGHNPPAVVKAVAEQLERGTHYGANHELEVLWGERVQRLVPSAERVRFTSSGTEATLLALRLARAHTGRPKLVRFLGHFHGWHDHMAFGVSSHFDGTPTPGVLPEIARDVRLVAPNDIDAVARALAENDVAAAIIEPTGASWGQVPVVPEFVRGLADLCQRHGTLLIFDEVISGFRCAPGGAQACLGIKPDLTTLAKILAGGLPGGAVAGRREILDGLDLAACAAMGREKIPHQGTFNAAPVSAAAGIATLDLLATTDACERANHYAARLRAALNQVLVERRVPWIVYGTYSGFHIFTNPERVVKSIEEITSGRVPPATFKNVDRNLAMKLRLGMLVHGVEIFSWPGGPTSAVHTDDDLRRTVDAFRGTLEMLHAEGLV